MKVKSVDKTAAVAWSPGNHSPLLALGTAAGAIDPTFNSAAELELYDLNLTKKGSKLTRVGGVSVTSRFNRLVWNNLPGDNQRPMGVIAGGFENGEIALWNAKSILESKADSQFFKQKAHNGSIKGLDFNPNQPNLLASGATEGELFIWDLNNPSKPYSPGSRSQKAENVTFLQWNKQVPHILATCSSNGYTIIWDLKSRKELSHLAYPGGYKPITSLAWHPSVPLQIATAADDDYNPSVLIWDLRNATAPINQLANGHSKSILGMSWCSKDTDLLLTCGKDNRTVLWNVTSMAPIGELHNSGNWAFDAQWCNKNPDLCVVASFDGKVTVHSLQGSDDSANEEMPVSPTHGVPDDPFAAAIMQGMNQTPKSTGNQFKLETAPKWYKRPVGVSWGFGGRLVSFNQTSTAINVRTIASESLFTSRVEGLRQVIYQDDIDGYINFINSKLNDKDASAQEKEIWNFLMFLFGGNQISEAIGYRKDFADSKLSGLVSKLKISEMKLGEVQKPAQTSNLNRKMSILSPPDQGVASGLFGDVANADFPIDAQLNDPNLTHTEAAVGPTPLPKYNSPLKLAFSNRASGDEVEIDALITKSLISGDYETAVKACFAANRVADALAIAISGGPDLLQKAQREYFLRSGEKKVYSRVLQDIVTMDIADVVEHTDLDEDPNVWKDVLTMIYTYSDPEDALKFLRGLGDRLDSLSSKSKPTDPSVIKSKRFAQKCGSIMSFMGAGELEKVVSLWHSEESSEKNESKLSYSLYISKLQSAIERISIYRKASNYVDRDVYASESNENFKLSQLYDQYIEYADAVTDQGILDFGWYFAQQVPDAYVTKTLKGRSSKIFKHRLYESGRVDTSNSVAKPQFPFEAVEVFDGEAYILQQQQYEQQQAYQQQQTFQQPQAYQQNQYGMGYTADYQPVNQGNQYVQESAYNNNSYGYNNNYSNNFAPAMNPPLSSTNSAGYDSHSNYSNAPSYGTQGANLWNPPPVTQKPPSAVVGPPPMGPAPTGMVPTRRKSSMSPVISSYPLPAVGNFQPNNTMYQGQNSFNYGNSPNSTAVAPSPAKPEPVDPKSKIPSNQRPIAEQLEKIVLGLNQDASTGLPQKKMLEEAEQRLSVLFTQMSSGLRQDVADKLMEIVKSIEKLDFATAHRIQLELMTTKFDVTGQWIVGIKRLIDVAERSHSLKSAPPSAYQPPRKPSATPQPGPTLLARPPISGPPQGAPAFTKPEAPQLQPPPQVRPPPQMINQRPPPAMPSQTGAFNPGPGQPMQQSVQPMPSQFMQSQPRPAPNAQLPPPPRMMYPTQQAPPRGPPVITAQQPQMGNYGRPPQGQQGYTMQYPPQNYQ